MCINLLQVSHSPLSIQHEIKNLYDDLLGHLTQPLLSLPMDVVPFSSVPIKTLLLGLWWIYAAADHTHSVTLLNGWLLVLKYIAVDIILKYMYVLLLVMCSLYMYNMQCMCIIFLMTLLSR